MKPTRQHALFDDAVPEAEPPSRPKALASDPSCYWDFCPNCGARLQNQRCKYRCPRCHYFMSCSDFD